MRCPAEKQEHSFVQSLPCAVRSEAVALVLDYEVRDWKREAPPRRLYTPLLEPGGILLTAGDDEELVRREGAEGNSLPDRIGPLCRRVSGADASRLYMVLVEIHHFEQC